MNFFGCHTPYASAIAWSLSARSVKGSSYFSLNFACFSGVSGLEPRMTELSLPNREKASRNPDASRVQPGVSAFGKK
jgi:hypothetical protein